MINRIFLTTIASLVLLALSGATLAKISAVPEPFKGATPDSTFSIKYIDVNDLLKITVVNTGRSSRERAASPSGETGTRMKQTIKRATVNEGNRFYYEAFKGDPAAAAALNNLKKSLELVPEQVPLGAFSRNEQLAYWLNLYNITLIDEITKIYPKRSLKKLLVGKKSILARNTLTVAGVSLSLNDIEFILRTNFNGDPMIIYGLYQGIIGGPNIRKVAYSGSNVYQALQSNAEEFINSNRGTDSKDEKTFRVSSLYKRDAVFFANDEALKTHLLRFLAGPERDQLQSASRIKRDINDWSITDLHGSSRSLGGSFANSKAALADSHSGTQPGDVANGGPANVSVNHSASSSNMLSKAPNDKRFSPDLMIRLQEISAKRDQVNRDGATVTVEELGAVEIESAEPDTDDKQEKL